MAVREEVNDYKKHCLHDTSEQLHDELIAVVTACASPGQIRPQQGERNQAHTPNPSCRATGKFCLLGDRETVSLSIAPGKSATL